MGERRKGIIISIHSIISLYTLNKLKVRCFLTDVKKGVVKDEKGIPCNFETDLYLAYDGHLKGRSKNAVDATLNSPFVLIEEEYYFFVDLNTYAHNN